MDATKKTKLMKKLSKWLMVLFIPLFSLTLTACGGDDKDEPDNPNPKDNITKDFLIGKWSTNLQTTPIGYQYETTIEFYKDGTFVFRYESDNLPSWGSTSTEYLFRGTYTLKNNKLTLQYSAYRDLNTFAGNYTTTCGLYYDNYTAKLVISVGSGDRITDSIYDQYSKIE